MPLTLVLRSTKLGPLGAAPSLTFDGPRIVIGRGAGCDVRLPDPSVSRRHATVRADGPDFALVDEGSSNGTFVGSERLSPHAPRVLKAGDLVRVGRVWLEARMDQTPATRDLATASRDLAMALVAQGMRAVGLDPTLTVRVSSAPVKGATADAGGRSPLRLDEEGRAYVVDDADDADLRFIRPAREPRTRLQVVRRDTQVLVRALEGASSIVLGSAPLAQGRDVAWRSTAPLRLGSATLTLDEPAATALADLETQPDEPVLEEDVPPPPAAANATDGTSVHVEAASEGTKTSGIAPVAKASGAAARPSWSTLDLAVLAAAVVVMGLSIAGVVWLLGG